MEYTRLHISPFTPALLNTILPASILLHARNISYHSIQTSEIGYGYVELPAMDAEKIKKKLSGSILKGTKVKIEKARPEKEVAIEPEEPEPPKKEKRKRKRDELPGVDIGERQVKRGWTTPAKDINSKDKVKSKYTTGPECLFKTNLPPNVASKIKTTEVKPEKRKRKAGKETVVHEFAKATKYATFLRSSGSNKSKGVAEYVEGKGWVDEEGNLVEEVVTKKRKHKAPVPEPPIEESESSEDSGNSEGEANDIAESTLPNPKVERETSSDDSSDDSFSEEEKEDASITKDTSDSSDSSSSDSESSDSSEYESEVEEPQSAVSNRSHTSIGPALSIKIPVSNDSTPINTSVHPLEALYKRPKAGEASSSKPTPPFFSFFGADGDEEEVEEESYSQVPLTPFTQKDFEYRGIRSAAPTPDTAHPNKRFIWPTDHDDDEEEPEPSSPIRKGEASEAKEAKEGEPESEFQKWFWENRGNVDRSWKARRRAAAKEKRQRENRKRQDRAL
ncbi:uncharacterized protein LY89DRAFT_779244 [Mollisia scopiformis]|uniref:Uncharacterized protein n=1 Tax=Mollisia scopiformis TaxID=149040 RepID=A0A194XK45_MOLSC|nr:uncharacterized protein LY89DRAFT_779244 [Mollisia scopiformis]KUJ20484.1 hypothetical protein LY89DRAFT_779244 [Mollisia scopiformis]